MPAVLASLTMMLVETVDIIAVGHLGNTEYLSGVGLATSILNIFIFGIYIGLNGAIDTMISQASGLNNHKLANQVLNKAYFINTVLFIPIAVVMFFSESIFTFLHIEPESSYYAYVYMLPLIPG